MRSAVSLGIVEMHFVIDDNKFLIVDVGGQVSRLARTLRFAPTCSLLMMLIVSFSSATSGRSGFIVLTALLPSSSWLTPVNMTRYVANAALPIIKWMV